MADDAVVIVDREGTEHEFPAGFDPKRAAFIVSQEHLAAANAKPLQAPTTYAGGFREGLRPTGKTLLDTLPGVGAMVGGALSTPETLGAGTIPGIALGTAAGRGLRDLIGHATGIDVPTSPGRKALNMGIDAGTAAATQAVVPGVVEAIKAPVPALRMASEEFSGAMPRSLRRLGKLLPSLPEAPRPIPRVSPDWLAGESAAAQTPPQAASAPVADTATGLSAADRAGLARQGYAPDVIAKIEGQLTPVPSHPLTGPRVDVGAEVVGRQQGMTKQAVRDATGPILGEAPGEASPVLPEKPLQRMIDTMRQLPKEGSARPDYVAAAKDPKTMAQLENLRRTLAHLGLVGAGAAGSRQVLLNGIDEQ